ncbi:MAG: serine protein kinase RIO [Candidatus Lokiarchaeota archaeon]|nr:serine protein kinase RIO [Candidatus Lokiarchaeota archaeon]
MVEKKIKEYELKIDKSREREKRSEDQSTAESVFDLNVRKIIFKLMQKGIIDQIYGAISTGKEANVYRATDSDGNDLAIKIYRITNAETKFMWKYITGDPRFSDVRKKPRNIVFAWAKKEFKNLNRAKEANVKVPNPIYQVKNLLVMEFIGENTIPAPKLKDVEIQNPNKIFNIIIEYINRLYNEANLVHGDLSEFNILMDNDEPVIIDISQAITLEHPNSLRYLLRDIKNICWYFSKLNLELPAPVEIYEYITKGE